MAFSLWKCLSLLVVVLLSFIASVAPEPKVLKMELNRRAKTIHADNIEGRDTGKQYANVLIENSINTNAYLVNASVGTSTPPQVVQLEVDTGSSDIWMIGVGSCHPRTAPCLNSTFNPSVSSSFSLLQKGGFRAQYESPNSEVQGDYFNDTFSIGSITLRNLTMAVAKEADGFTTGIMGIGFDAGESIVIQGGQPYPNIIDMMVAQGIIQTRAYSLWLNDQAANGAVLFGGFDQAKFKGDLIAVPMQPDSQSGQVTSMTVAWTSLSVIQSGNTTFTTNSNFVEPAILDSGTSLTFLPIDTFNEVTSLFPVFEDLNFPSGLLVNCEEFDDYNGTIDYGFGGSGGPVISVPLSDLALPVFNSRGDTLHFSNGEPACLFGIAPLTKNEPIILGDTFLRSAYVVYDLDNKQIAMAPSVANTTESNIVEIGQGAAAPTWKVASAVSAIQTATGLGEGPTVLSAPTGQITADASATGSLPASSGSEATTTPSTAKSAAPSPILPGTIRSILFSFLSSLLGAAFVAFH